MGFVANNSNVPLLNSSDKVRIVIAGIRKTKTHGAVAKNGSKEAYKPSNILPGKTHKFSPKKRKNTPMLMYPIKELKNPFISFLNILIIIY